MADDWKHTGVRVIPGDQLDPNTAQTPGMNRAAAINFARVGAEKLWAGTVTIHAGAKTGAHHHGALESVIYVLKGRARMRWGEALEFTAEAGPGDFIYVPPYVPHQEINASDDEPLECVLVRSGGEAVVVNLDIAAVEQPTGGGLGRLHPQTCLTRRSLRDEQSSEVPAAGARLVAASFVLRAQQEFEIAHEIRATPGSGPASCGRSRCAAAACLVQKASGNETPPEMSSYFSSPSGRTGSASPSSG